jgi:chitinase
MLIYLEPSNIPVTKLTHLLYSFADTRADSGNIFLTDSYADEQVSSRKL